MTFGNEVICIFLFTSLRSESWRRIIPYEYVRKCFTSTTGGVVMLYIPILSSYLMWFFTLTCTPSVPNCKSLSHSVFLSLLDVLQCISGCIAKYVPRKARTDFRFGMEGVVNRTMNVFYFTICNLQPCWFFGNLKADPCMLNL
jgi:hypothetical protein